MIQIKCGFNLKRKKKTIREKRNIEKLQYEVIGSRIDWKICVAI